METTNFCTFCGKDSDSVNLVTFPEYNEVSGVFTACIVCPECAQDAYQNMCSLLKRYENNTDQDAFAHVIGGPLVTFVMKQYPQLGLMMLLEKNVKSKIKMIKCYLEQLKQGNENVLANFKIESEDRRFLGTLM